jgi:hypothetical protein
MESIQERIEHRAYDLYLKRGKIPGFHEEDWRQAEKEILAEVEAGKKAEASRVAGVKAWKTPLPVESKPVPAPARAAVPEQPRFSGIPAESAQQKPKAPGAVKPVSKITRKKK